jgi:hypothetical protein
MILVYGLCRLNYLINNPLPLHLPEYTYIHNFYMQIPNIQQITSRQ